ncbi:hypothetical protein Tco_1198725 [Tanacetum coccineum]
MTTLAEHIIVVGAENRPPMLEKSMYDSWASRIRLFIKGKKHGRMMLDSINNGPSVYPTVEENGQTRPKKYSELTEAQQLQEDYDIQATNIILHGLPPDVLYNMFDKFAYVQGEIEEGHMARQCTQPKRPRNTAWFKEKLMLAKAQEAGQILDEEQLEFLADPGMDEALVAQQTIPHNAAFQTEDLDAYYSDCDDLSSAKAVLMANLSSCDSDVLSEVPYSDAYPNDMLNQDVQEMPYSEQTHIVDSLDNEIHNDSNIIPRSQYLQETQDARSSS